MSNDAGLTCNPSEPTVTGAIEERCLARLDHDLRELSNFARAVGHERFQMGVAAFGGRTLMKTGCPLRRDH